MNKNTSCDICGDMKATRLYKEQYICEFCEDRIKFGKYLEIIHRMSIKVFNRLAGKQKYRCADCEKFGELLPIKNREKVVRLICSECRNAQA